jgi:hypothetical protein
LVKKNGTTSESTPVEDVLASNSSDGRLDDDFRRKRRKNTAALEWTAVSLTAYASSEIRSFIFSFNGRSISKL